MNVFYRKWIDPGAVEGGPGPLKAIWEELRQQLSVNEEEKRL